MLIEKNPSVFNWVAKGLILFTLVCCVVYCFEIWGQQTISRLAEYVIAQGNAGIAIYLLANILATLLCIPQGVMTIMAGAVFGWKIESLCASLGMILGAFCAYSLARLYGREWLLGVLLKIRCFKKCKA